MVLTDREIEAAIQNGRIVIDPVPGPDMFSSTSLDLTLLSSARHWKKVTPGVKQEICPADNEFSYSEVASEHTLSVEIGDGFALGPDGFLLAWTAETVNLPVASGIAARVEGKSSLSRLGVGVHLTAPIIHSGFSGPIQLELCNHGPLTIQLKAGMRVCQLVFEQTFGTPEKGYKGQFQNQKA